MTAEEARKRLDDWPPPMRRVSWIEKAIAYETHEGIHTSSTCSCGRAETRAGECVLCLKELLAEAQRGEGK